MAYACKDRPPYEQQMLVQDGWQNTWARRMVDMEFRMSLACQYRDTDLGKADPKCSGCKWRTDDAERTPGPPAVADGSALDGGIQGPLLAESAGHSNGPGNVGTAKPADSGDAKALEKLESKWGSIYRPTEE